jgi:hypothetical protein
MSALYVYTTTSMGTNINIPQENELIELFSMGYNSGSAQWRFGRALDS